MDVGTTRPVCQSTRLDIRSHGPRLLIHIARVDSAKCEAPLCQGTEMEGKIIAYIKNTRQLDSTHFTQP